MNSSLSQSKKTEAKSADIWFITGPMFSNKTKKLIQIIKFISKKTDNFLIFKSKIDTRKSKNIIYSRFGSSMPAIPVRDHHQIWKIFNAKHTVPKYVFINEINFFSEDIVEIIKKMAASKTKIVCDGLRLDFKNEYFPSTKKLEQAATKIIHQKASCAKCFQPARLSQRLTKSTSVVLVGDSDIYEARCQKCHLL